MSVSSRGGSKSRAEGAFSAAAFDILAKVTSSASEESDTCKKKKLEEMLKVLSKQCSSRHSKTDRIRNKEDLACNKI